MNGEFYDIVYLQNVKKEVVSQFIDRAAHLDIGILILSGIFLNVDEVLKLKSLVKESPDGPNIKIAARIQEEQVSKMVKAVRLFRNSCDLIIVEGGHLDINRKAFEMPEVDIVAHPDNGRKESGFDHIMAELGANNHVGVGFDFRRLIVSNSWKRNRVLQAMQNQLKLCLHKKTPFVVFSDARKPVEMRSPRDMCSVCTVLGAEVSTSILSVTEYPSFMLKHAEKVGLKDFIRPGIERDSNES